MNTSTMLYIASDHAGFALKESIKMELSTIIQFEDLGTNTTQSCDYPIFAHTLCKKVLETGNKGILICGTGMGMSITANRYRGIRAALCTFEFHAKACREHNDANILCLGARITAPGLASLITKTFVETSFEGERHQRRIDLIEEY